MSEPAPYRLTPVFDQDPLLAGLRARHDTKAGVWGMIRVIEGQLLPSYLDPLSRIMLSPDRPRPAPPEQPHFIAPVGPMKMRVDFYDRSPAGE